MQPTQPMQHTGSCHCGNVRFTVEGTIDSGLACNCSLCHRRGSLLWFAPRSALQLQTPEPQLGSYRFRKHAIDHRFCPRCGIHTHGEGTSPGGDAVVAVNIRCIEGFDTDSVPVTHYDGRAV